MFEITTGILNDQIKMLASRCRFIIDKKELDIIDRQINKIEKEIQFLGDLELIAKGKVETVDSWSYINDANLDCLIGDKYDGKEIEIYVVQSFCLLY